MLVRLARGDRAGAPVGVDNSVLEKLDRVVYRDKDATGPRPSLDSTSTATRPPKEASKPGFFQRIMSTHKSSVPKQPEMPIPDLYIDDVGDQSCSICLDNYVDGDILRRLPCEHVFHESCVDTWLRLNGHCPLCKRRVDGKEDPPEPTTALQQSEGGNVMATESSSSERV